MGKRQNTSGGEPATPATEGDRGGGFAYAHRHNLDAAPRNNQALSKGIAAALQRNSSSGNAAGGGH